MQTRLTAHFSRFIKGWTNACALVTQQRAGGFNVYMYTSDGMHETYVQEVKVTDVNVALKIARDYATNPDSLEVIDDKTYEPLVMWTAPKGGK